MIIEEKALELIKKGEKALFAVIVETAGSSPRDTGARMLVQEGGTITGTIGGGPIEYAVTKKLEEVAASGKTVLIPFNMNNNDREKALLICGGEMTVCMHPLSKEDEAGLQEVCEAAAKGESLTYAIVRTEPEKACIRCLKDGEAKDGEDIIYCGEPVLPERLYLMGGGHVSAATAVIAATAGFGITVMDDREEFANNERFPEAQCIVCRDYDELPVERIKENDYIVIATRGHKADYIALEWALKTKACYIGMVSSKRKRDLVYESLEAKGVTKERLAEIHSPIGLPIGGRTPGEIGVSIVAEMIVNRTAMAKGETAAHAAKKA